MIPDCLQLKVLIISPQCSAVTLVVMVEMKGSARLLNSEAEISRVRLDDVVMSGCTTLDEYRCRTTYELIC